jgi:gluconate 5-dehydrogenase
MSTRLFDLTDRVALVTGATSGIGLALARGLAEAGAKVVVNGRAPVRIAQTVETLAALGLKAHGSRFDVAVADEIAAEVARIEGEIGAIDILVNNAGIQRRAPLLDLDPAIWDEVIRTNLTGVFLVGQAVARVMAPRGRG